METWTPADVKTFLLAKGFDEETAGKMESEEIDGTALKVIASDSNLKPYAENLDIKLGKLFKLRSVYFAKPRVSLTVQNHNHFVQVSLTVLDNFFGFNCQS